MSDFQPLARNREALFLVTQRSMSEQRGPGLPGGPLGWGAPALRCSPRRPPPPAPTSRLSGEDGECVRALGRWVLSEPQILTPSSLSGKNPETWPR